jgi:orotidine-5'-phosphate decarboxylase
MRLKKSRIKREVFMVFKNAKDRLVLACDKSAVKKAGQELSPAGELITKVGHLVRWIKINSAFVGGGHSLAAMVQKAGADLWLDLKWHDVVETLKNYIDEAVMSIQNMRMLNVHASGGLNMMKAVKEKLDELFPPENAAQRPLAIAITVLTSIDEEEAKRLGFSCSIAEQVMRLAKLTKEAGLDGVVASGLEAEMLRKEFGPDFLIVTPGIRFEEESKGAQKRVTTPKQAILSGADMIVMGTSLINGGEDAVKRAIAEIEEGLMFKTA